MSAESPIHAYLEKPSMVDYPGRFAAVFFTSGCNFACGFCHNAELMAKRRAGLSWNQLESACKGFRRAWVDSIVLTGGEPTLVDDLSGLLRFFKDRFGFAIKLDTNGSNPDRLAECLPLVDYAAMDIKCGLDAYPDHTGFAESEKIKTSIALIRSQAKEYEFRTTVMESIHADEQMDEIAELVDGSQRYALQPFIPRDHLPGKRYRTLPRTSSKRLHELRERMEGCAKEILVRGA